MLYLGPSQGEKKGRERGKDSERSELPADPTEEEEEEDEKKVGHNWRGWRSQCSHQPRWGKQP
jgi:hypothetical protein